MFYVNLAIALLCFIGAFIEGNQLHNPIAIAYAGFGIGYLGLTWVYGGL